MVFIFLSVLFKNNLRTCTYQKDQDILALFTFPIEHPLIFLIVDPFLSFQKSKQTLHFLSKASLSSRTHFHRSKPKSRKPFKIKTKIKPAATKDQEKKKSQGGNPFKNIYIPTTLLFANYSIKK